MSYKMDSDDDSSSMFVPPPFPVFPLKSPGRKHKQGPSAHQGFIVPNRPASAEHPYPFNDALVTNLARLTAHNTSLNPQAFLLFPSEPTLVRFPSEPAGLRIGVFQSSQLVKKLSEGGSFGSITFLLPFDKPLSWANTRASPGIIVIAGTELSEDKIQTRTDWTLLSSGETDGRPAKNVCVMSMPQGNEPCFLSSADVAKKNYPVENNLEPGTIVIRTDNLDGIDSDSDVQPFVGIGAINPRFRRTITPIITWVVQPNSRYQIKPNMSTWQLASGTPKVPGTIIDPKLLSNTIPVTFKAPPNEPANVYLGTDNFFVT